MFKRRLKVVSLVLCLCWVWVSYATDFREGVDYQRVTPVQLVPHDSPNKVQVMEFFNYGCPICYTVEKDLQQWRHRQAAKIAWQRWPVAFNPAWERLAKAFLIAQRLNIADKLTPLIFRTLHEENQDISDLSELSKVFARFGVTPQAFQKTMRSSPSLAAELAQAKRLFIGYKLAGVPAFVVADRFKVDLQMVKGDKQRLFGVLDHLVKTASQQ